MPKIMDSIATEIRIDDPVTFKPEDNAVEVLVKAKKAEAATEEKNINPEKKETGKVAEKVTDAIIEAKKSKDPEKVSFIKKISDKALAAGDKLAEKLEFYLGLSRPQISGINREQFIEECVRAGLDPNSEDVQTAAKYFRLPFSRSKGTDRNPYGRFQPATEEDKMRMAETKPHETTQSIAPALTPVEVDERDERRPVSPDLELQWLKRSRRNLDPDFIEPYPDESKGQEMDIVHKKRKRKRKAKDPVRSALAPKPNTISDSESELETA